MAVEDPATQLAPWVAVPFPGSLRKGLLLSRWSDTTHAYVLIATSFVMDLLTRNAAQATQYAGIAFGATAAELGLIAATATFCYSLTSLVSGRLSDRIGRRRGAVLACAVLIAAHAALMSAGTKWQLAVLASVAGTGSALFWPGMQAWMAELGGKTKFQLNRLLGTFNVTWAAGLVVGPVVAGQVWLLGQATGHSQEWCYAVSVLCGVVVLGMVLAVRTCPPSGCAETADTEVEPRHPQATTYLHMSWAANFASWFAGGVVAGLFPKLGHELGYDQGLIGLLAAAVHVGQVTMFAIILSTTRWQFRRWPLFGALGLGIAGAGCSAAAPHPGLFALGFLLLGLCAGTTYVGSLFYALQGGGGQRGSRTGLHEAVLGSGVFFGPLLGGALATATRDLLGPVPSLRAPYVAAALVFVGSGVAQLVIWRRREGRPVQTPLSA